MDFIKKHVDTVVVLTAILTSVMWMNSKFNSLDKEILVIKTVMIMRGILPNELAISSHIDDVKGG